MNPPPLDWQFLASRLGGDLLDYQPETGSTNDDARAQALRGAPHGFLVITDTQTAGRGRRGAAWISPPRRNLLCSIVLRPSLPMEKWARLTHACALSVSEALESIPDLPVPRIKWPNDIYLRGRKVCGILVESVADSRGGFVIAGAGVNLNLTSGEFPHDLQETATSVWVERGGQAVSREAFALTFVERLLVNCSRAEAGFTALLADCGTRSFLQGRRIRLTSNGRAMEGITPGTGPEGELLLRTDDGRLHTITSADFVRPAGEEFPAAF